MDEDEDNIVAALRRGEDGWEYAAADEIEALRAENARLREALNPFAVVAEMTIGESEDDRDLFRPARNGPRLIVADFRKARAAMGDADDA